MTITNERLEYLIAAHDNPDNWGYSIETVAALRELQSLRASRAQSEQMRGEAGCICRGNWRLIVSEYEKLIGRKYRYVYNGKDHGKVFRFFGIVHGGDDYYYGMIANGVLRLLTCVGSPETCGFELLPGKSDYDLLVEKYGSDPNITPSAGGG